MISSTNGIVISCINYSETSIICKIYTEHFGIQSYIVKGARRKNSKLKKNLFSSLNVLNLIANHNNKDGLVNLRDASTVYNLNNIYTNLQKMCIVQYISELLHKVLITSSTPDEQLFQFLKTEIQNINETEDALSMTPIVFSMKLTHFLGIFPMLNFGANNKFFNIQEGRFVGSTSDSTMCVDAVESDIFYNLLKNLDNQDYKLSKSNRNIMLELIQKYFKVHISGFGEMKSIPILSEVLKD